MKTKEAEYLLLFHGHRWDEGMSDTQLRQVMDQVIAWFQGLEKRGIVKGGEALAPEGRVVTAKSNGNISDGPFVETKEAVGGYLLLRGVSYDEVLQIVRSNPTLPYGITVEIRPLLVQCPIFERLQTESNLVSA